jgi:hypothetical protein
MSGSLVDRDLGMKSLASRMRAMSKSYTKVGIQAGSKESDGVTDLVTVAAANEYGTDTIPERSFMRSTFDENREKIAQITKAENSAVLAGRKGIRESLAQIGEYFQGLVQAKIHSHPAPENAPATIAKKGSSGTLVDSGQLVQSVRHVELVSGGEK